ncbi:hypothetical protein [Erwinia aphidicola]|uniref:hypothetical protein n=1 Tax=Erwinia aphidicola TaxID=68334 RepID=UPI00301AE722
MTIKTKITAQPVLRDASGCWTHSEFFVPESDGGPVLEAEFRAWLTHHGLRSAASWMENEVTDEMMAAYDNGFSDFSAWLPVAPGPEWFVGSIHDTQAGPVCVWLRPVTGEGCAS